MLRTSVRLLVACYFLASVAAEPDEYPVPDPFSTTENDTGEARFREGFWHIESVKKITRPRAGQVGEKIEVKVEDYFSLTKGISYSLHKDLSEVEPSFKPYAIISDGPRGRTYLVRDALAETSNQIDCELDHSHTHRHAFPWHFEYALPDGSDGPDGIVWSKDVKIYGIGAIWLNAIKEKLTSQTIGDSSPLKESNFWYLERNDVSVAFWFTKPQVTSGNDLEAKRKLVAESSLVSLEVVHKNSVVSEKMGSSNEIFGEYNVKCVVIDYSLIEDEKSYELLRFMHQLKQCRKKTRRQRVFPSLMRALAYSPSRVYSLEYVATRFGEMRLKSEQEFNEKHHRYLHNQELVSEWFSLKKEAHVMIYREMPKGGISPDDKVDHSRVDVFTRMFTFYKYLQRDPSTNKNALFHTVESDSSDSDKCEPAETDPAPKWFQLLSRRVHFGLNLDGRMNGLGALLMNAMDRRNKRFLMTKREISIVYDPADLNLRQNVEVDEWQIIDKAAGKSVHFYFFAQEKFYQNHEISDLVRIDIKKTDDSSTQISEGQPESDEDETKNLLMRYDIVSFTTEPDSKSLADAFRVSRDCSIRAKENGALAKNFGLTVAEETEMYLARTTQKGNEEEESGEEDALELELGSLLESFQFPDFLTYLDGNATYAFESSIEFRLGYSPQGVEYLDERVDLESGLARYMIYHDTKEGKLDPDLEFIINYNSELVFRIFKEKEERKCIITENVEPWLRTLSTSMHYLKRGDEGNVLIEESKLQLYGIGALWQAVAGSEYTDYVGMAPELIKKDFGEFKQVHWELYDYDNHGYQINVGFLFNQTQYELNGAQYSSDLLRLSDMDVTSNVATNQHHLIKVLSQPYLGRGPHFDLPQTCQVALDEYNARHSSPKFTTSQLPPFNSLIPHLANAYETRYRVTHSKPGQKGLVQSDITEFYDRASNRGRVIIGELDQVRTIFIEGPQKRIYEYSETTKKCRMLTSLKGIVDSDAGFVREVKSEDLGDRDAIDMIGLAGLWNSVCQKAAGNEVMLEVRHKQLMDGTKVELRTYRHVDKSRMQQNKKVSCMTELYFTGREAKSLSMSNEPKEVQLTLDKIEFVPRLVGTSNTDSNVRLHRSTVNVESLKSKEKLDSWDLPESCASLLGRKDEDIKFPKLTDLIELDGQFFMRSEITGGSIRIDNEPQMLLLDEWVFGGELRMKSSGLKKNFDLLLYANTGETFDISEPYTCHRRLPKFPGAVEQEGPGLRELWSHKSGQPVSLSSLYYGPVSLWLLAERNPGQVKLDNQGEIAPTGTKTNIADPFDSMQFETWQVDSPSGKWSYKMYFDRVSSRVGESVVEWHILKRIVATELLDLQAKLERKTEANIMNYRYEDEQLADITRLPEGYGCARDPEVEQKVQTVEEKLSVDMKNSYSVLYEASLEFFEPDDELGSRKRALPTVCGTFTKVFESSDSRWIDLRAYNQKTRYLNGTQVNKKLVHDRVHGLVYQIDCDRGTCVRSDSIQIKALPWTLEFPSGSESLETVLIDEQMLDLLVGSPNSPPYYSQLNRYFNDHSQVGIYEFRGSSNLELQLGPNLSGPVAIIRRFEVPTHAPKMSKSNEWTYEIKEHSSRNIMIHLRDSVTVRVLVFNPSRTKIRAELIFHLEKVTNIGLEKSLEKLGIAQECLAQEGETRAFALVYDLSLVKHFDLCVPDLQQQLIFALVFRANIMPIQLVGPPRFEFLGQKSQLRAVFSMTDPPSATSYSKTRKDNARMTEAMETQAEVMLVPTLKECMKKCDDLQCLALSFCQDRACRLLTMTEKQQRDGVQLADMASLEQSAYDTTCTYYHTAGYPARSRGQAKTLNLFSRDMDSLINARKDLNVLKQFNLNFKHHDKAKSEFSLEAIKFEEVRADFSDFSEDSASGLSEGLFKTVSHNVKLNPEKFTEHQIKMTFSDYATCLSTCQASQDCVLLSHCRKSQFCSILLDSPEIDLLNPESLFAEEADCQVMTRDYLRAYRAFPDTQEPAYFLEKFPGYNENNCALTCEMNSGCLSFDHCVIEDTTVCYLQKTHISLNSTHAHTLSTQDNKHSKIRCAHYSKSMLADYEKLQYQALLHPTNQTVRGSSPEKCAQDCSESDCLAFEHCLNLEMKPSQSCRFIHPGHLSQEQQTFRAGLALTSLFKSSDKCSIYVLRRTPELDTANLNNPEFTTSQDPTRQSKLQSFLHTLTYMAAGLALGIVIQFICAKYYRTRAGPLINNNPYLLNQM